MTSPASSRVSPRLQDSPLRSTVRSAWTTGRQSDFSNIDLHSPKIIAAAKVTGILIDELREPFERETSQASQPTPAEERRREVMERKRFMLMQELEDTADNLDPLEIDNIVSGRNTPAWRGVDDIYEREKAKIDRNRAKALEELRREAMREVEKQKATLESKAYCDKKEERIREALAAKVEKVQKMREAKFVALETNRTAVRLKRREKHERTVNRLKTKEERYSKHMDELMQARESNLEEKHRKDTDAWRRVADKEAKRFQANLQKIEADETRFDILEEWLENRRLDNEERLERSANETVTRTHIVQDQQQRKSLALETACLSNMDRVNKAREINAQNLEERQEKVRERREKQLTQWTKNRQAKISERRGWVAKKKQEHADSLERRAATAREYREKVSEPRLLTRSLYNELVHQNQDRMRRVEEGFRERTIMQILDNKMRAESIEDQRRQVDEYRVDATRERWYGKTQIEDLKFCMRNATPEQLRGSAPSRMTDILQDLGVTIGETQTEKEGEEEEQQRK